MAKLTVITVNYNNEQGLFRTLKSMQEQSLEGVEFIVIDGASKDASVELIKKHAHIIDYWLSEPDNGVYDAMNKGIVKATGEYVLFLNSGDHFYAPKTLGKALSLITEDDIVCFDINTVLNGIEKVKTHPEELRVGYLFTNTFAHQSTFIKKSLFTSVGLYDTNYKIVSDWKFFIEAIIRHNVTYKSIPFLITTYYLDGMSATASGTNTRKFERREILTKDYGFFVKDYQDLRTFQSNRFKMLKALENNFFTRKLNSVWLRSLVFFTKFKTPNQL